MPTKQEFTTDLEAIRKRARTQMMDGAVTKAYTADRERVLKGGSRGRAYRH